MTRIKPFDVYHQLFSPRNSKNILSLALLFFFISSRACTDKSVIPVKSLDLVDFGGFFAKTACPRRKQYTTKGHF